MQQPIRWRSIFLAPVFALIVGMLVSLVACVPENTGASPQGAVNATLTTRPTCPGASSSQACTPQPASKGTLSGKVVAGPTCPVERADNPCPPRPVPNRLVVIETSAGTIVSSVLTDQQGQFVVMLTPGTYQVLVPPDGNPFPRQRMPQKVTVVAGQTVQVMVELDTGIR